MLCACWRTCNTVVPKLVTRQVTVLALWCRFLTSLFCCKAFSEALLRKHFGTEISTIGGIGLKDIAREYTELNQAAFFPSPVVKAEEKYFLPNNGLFSYRKDGIEHAWNPETITKLQLATRLGSYKQFKEWAAIVDTHTATGDVEKGERPSSSAICSPSRRQPRRHRSTRWNRWRASFATSSQEPCRSERSASRHTRHLPWQ